VSTRIACRSILLAAALTCLPAWGALALAAVAPPPPRRPVVHYTFDNGSATNVQQPGTRDGTLAGGATISDGALRLNGTSAYLDVNDGAALDFSHGVRVAARVRRAANVDEDAVAGKWGWNTDQWLLTFYPGGNGSLRFGVRFSDGTGGEVHYSLPDTSYLGAWVDVEASYAPAEGLTLSWNGAVVARDRSVAGRTIAEGPQPIQVGEAGFWMDRTCFEGEVADLTIWAEVGQVIDFCSADYLTPEANDRWRINYDSLRRVFRDNVKRLADDEGRGYAFVNAGGPHDPLTLDFSQCSERTVFPGRNAVYKVAVPNVSSYTRPKHKNLPAGVTAIPQSSVFPFDSAVVGLFAKGEVGIKAPGITFVGDGLDRIVHGVPSWYSPSNLIPDRSLPVETLHIAGAEAPVRLTDIRDRKVNYCLMASEEGVKQPIRCDDGRFGGEVALGCRVEPRPTDPQPTPETGCRDLLGTVVPLGSAAPTVIGAENVSLDIADFVIDAVPGGLPGEPSDVTWSYARGITLIYTYYNEDGEGHGNLQSPLIALTARNGSIANAPWDSITSSGPVNLHIEDCSITQHAAFLSRRGAAIGSNRNHPRSDMQVVASDDHRVEIVADKGIWNFIERKLYEDVPLDGNAHLTIQGDVRLHTGQWSLTTSGNPATELQHASDPSVGPVIVIDSDMSYVGCESPSDPRSWPAAKVAANPASRLTGINPRFQMLETPPAGGGSWVKLLRADMGTPAGNFENVFLQAVKVDSLEIARGSKTAFVLDVPELARTIAASLPPEMVVLSALVSYDFATDSIYVSVNSTSQVLHYFYRNLEDAPAARPPIDLCTFAPVGYVPAGARDHTVTVGDLTFHFNGSRDEGVIHVTPLSGVGRGTAAPRLLDRGWQISSTLPPYTFDVEITFPYTDAEVAGLGVDEARLRPFHSQRRGGAPWVWEEARLAGQDVLLNTVTARTSHFSRWTLGAWPPLRHWPHR
jgi:hypothetical protein